MSRRVDLARAGTEGPKCQHLYLRAADGAGGRARGARGDARRGCDRIGQRLQGVGASAGSPGGAGAGRGLGGVGGRHGSALTPRLRLELGVEAVEVVPLHLLVLVRTIDLVD
eukprot:CAMPEP_0113821184 /NCGR_PEP_ID=MMETSP0328-20130328/1611_1 /TAXON_ID=39455 /ORGANISM="Alexandrium minutum" /LENGTH=111 /DNA_ID=CAMNT_0000789115 /DNA_START=13 /DNA_END=348 /DNA_ORIENTATION=+ /assembly_acc=CAM_ASM_000350